jgi:hypothetical protein
MDGDDRKNFIGMNSVDVLYWWDVMDRLSMIFMFMGKLHDGISASSNRTPASTARRRAGDETNSNTQSNKKSKSGRDDMQRELVRNVGEINKSMSVVALAMIRQKLSDAEDKKYQLEDVLDNLDSISDEKKYQRTVKRLKDVQNDIDTYKLQIEDAEGTEARQLERQLDYQGDVGV